MIQQIGITCSNRTGSTSASRCSGPIEDECSGAVLAALGKYRLDQRRGDRYRQAPTSALPASIRAEFSKRATSSPSFPVLRLG